MAMDEGWVCFDLGSEKRETEREIIKNNKEILFKWSGKKIEPLMFGVL